ncbi:MAG TPA: hypothetical protein VKZ18_24775 [Polyangia bacterium]|nr:hypothetical protein [Polyangia bacterium]
MIAYIDILGWKELLKARRGKRRYEQIMRAIVELKTAVEIVEMTKRGFARVGAPFGHSLRATMFSDTIVCSCDPTQDEAAHLGDWVQRFCVRMLHLGRFTRGAITIGDLLHDPGGVVVGRALVEASVLEQKVAKYPRIVVTEEATDLLVGPRYFPNGTLGPRQATQDTDGLFYLDIFGFDQGHKRSARAIADAKKGKRTVERTLGEVLDPHRFKQYRDPTVAMELHAKAEWMWHQVHRVIGYPKE